MIDLKTIPDETMQRMMNIYEEKFGGCASIRISSRKKDDYVTVHSHKGSMVFDASGNVVA